MLFDSHAHLISRDFEKYPLTPLSGQTLQPEDIASIVTAEDMLDLMDKHNVERALVVQRAHVYGFNNSYVVDAANQYPDRFTAMCMIDALADNAADTVRYWVNRGAIAIRMTEPFKNAPTDWFASLKAQAVWAAANELGISVRLHFYAWNREKCIKALLPLLDQYPRVQVVVDHLSSPDPKKGIEGIDELLVQLAMHNNAALLISTINFNRYRDASMSSAGVVAEAVKVFGAERILWGSDIAQTMGDYTDMITAAKNAVSQCDPSDADKILYANGRRFYSNS